MSQLVWNGKINYLTLTSFMILHNQQARIDASTQDGNRYYFKDEIQKILDYKISETLCYRDLDHLKYVNDHFGHDVGDQYICEFVKMIL